MQEKNKTTANYDRFRKSNAPSYKVPGGKSISTPSSASTLLAPYIHRNKVEVHLINKKYKL